MACFIVPAAEAVVTRIVSKKVEVKEVETEEGVAHIPFSRKLKWLSHLLVGGSVLLAFEHVWHGEVTPWLPFLTATSNPVDASAMLHEMATTGVAMAAVVTVVWLGIVAVTSKMEQKEVKLQALKVKGVEEK